MSTEFNVEYSLNKVLSKLLRANGIRPFLMPCACQRPITDNGWTIDLPKDIPSEQWNDPRFRLIVHAQDFVTWYEDCCLELLWLEKQYTPEQLRKIIFVHWDHRLREVYSGPITCVEFPTHSYELVHTLKQRWNRWRHIPENKSPTMNWICLNGRARQYRQEVYRILENETSGFASHSSFRPIPQLPYQQYNFNNVENFIAIGEVYQNARVSVVTESIYADHPGIITEKTLLAIAAKHPFMCIGHRGIHTEISDRGFCNYTDLFDLSYDTESMNTRLHSALEKNLPILRGEINLESCNDVVESNFDFLMNDYLDSVVETARTQILEHLVQT